MHALVLCISTRNFKFLASPIAQIWLGQNLKTGHVTLTTPIMGGGCHPKASTWYILLAHKIEWLLLQPFWRYDCGRRNWKWVMWPWPRNFLLWFFIVIQKLGFDTVYICAKFDDSSFSRSRDHWGPKFKVGHVTMSTPHLRVICPLYTETWYSLPAYKIWWL